MLDLQKWSLIGLSLLVGLSGPVFADDNIDWAGSDLGIGLGAGFGSANVTGNRFTYDSNAAVNRVDHTFSGAGGEIYAGRNFTAGRIVYGGEVGLSWADLNSAMVFNADDDIDEASVGLTGTLSGRLGYSFDNLLLYLKAGVALAQTRNIGGDVDGGVLDAADAHDRNGLQVGPLVGIGGEHQLPKGIRLRIEYTYTDFFSYREANDQGAVPGSQSYVVDNGPIQRVTVGLIMPF